MYNKSTVIIGLIVFLLAVISPTLYNASTFGLGEAPGPDVEIDRAIAGDECVEDTDWMRANHMTYLYEGREMVIREGIRDTNQSIARCRECHPTRGEFCSSCKEYVGIKVECWTCHHYPETEEEIIE